MSEQVESIKVAMTEKGQFVLPLSLMLHEELPDIPFMKCCEIADRLWLRLNEWPEVISE